MNHTVPSTELDNETMVLVALSGGVDSAVVLNILKENYTNIHGLSHRHWPESKCCTTACIDTCRSQCVDSGVPYSTIDTMVEFAQEIVDPFVEAYESGTTPNPCVQCNRKNRFGHMVQKFFEQRKENPPEKYKIATGHYARIHFDGAQYWLKQGKDSTKDQSYMLYRLSQEQLSHALFPLGEREKPEVREMAVEWKLESAKKEDSQDICFVEKDYRDFLKDYTGKMGVPGDFVDVNGKVLGNHNGTAYYTRGQRKGLGLGGGPWYVLEILPQENRIILGDQEQLKTNVLEIRDCIWHHPSLPDEFECRLQARYHGIYHECQVKKLAEDKYRIELNEPALDISPGQSAVLYFDKILWGGGIIQNNLVPLNNNTK